MNDRYVGKEINGFVVVLRCDKHKELPNNRNPHYIVKCKKCGELYKVRIDNLKSRGLRCMGCRNYEKFENM